jgi:AraC-like DNA-binding protein
MSKDLGIPRHILSRMINTQYGMNFNALINHFRVDYLKGIPSREPSWNLFTMEALGKMAGFNSRNTLIKAFKKCTGESPSSYFSRQMAGKDEQRHFFDYDLQTKVMMN